MYNIIDPANKDIPFLFYYLIPLSYKVFIILRYVPSSSCLFRILFITEGCCDLLQACSVARRRLCKFCPCVHLWDDIHLLICMQWSLTSVLPILFYENLGASWCSTVKFICIWFGFQLVLTSKYGTSLSYLLESSVVFYCRNLKL